MRKMTKRWLITAACLMVSGLILLVGAMADLAWDLTRLSTVKYETNTYAPGENFDNISIAAGTAQIELVPADDGKCRVVCFDEKNVKHSAAVENGTLVIGTVDTRKWYEHIGIFFRTAPKITVYLPREAYASLFIDTGTGNIAIPGDFTFETLRIRGATSDVECLASVSDVMEIRSNTGRITVDGPSADQLRLVTATGAIYVRSVASRGDLDIEISTGTVELTDVACANLTAKSATGTIILTNVVAEGSFSITNSTGVVRFENSDAAQISVRTSTGDVTGSLLSEKVFIAETSTGSVNVPKTTSGGLCEITTSTGNIRITLAG